MFNLHEHNEPWPEHEAWKIYLHSHQLHRPQPFLNPGQTHSWARNTLPLTEQKVSLSYYRWPVDPIPSQFNPIQSILLLTAILTFYFHLLGNKIMWKHLYRNKRQYNSNSTRRHINIYEPVTFISASICNSKIQFLFTGQIIFLLETVPKNHGIHTNARSYFKRNEHLSKSESDLASYNSWLPTPSHKIWLFTHRQIQ
jgi:hypothetical protein